MQVKWTKMKLVRKDLGSAVGSVSDYNPLSSQIESQKFPDSVSRRFFLDLSSENFEEENCHFKMK